MRKISFILAIIFLVLSVSACGVKTVEDACKKADDMLVEWSRERLADCSYDGEYTKIDGVYYYTVTAKSQYSTSHPDISSSYYADVVMNELMKESANRILETPYAKLSDLFDKFEVPVLIMITDSNNIPYYGIIDGEITRID